MKRVMIYLASLCVAAMTLSCDKAVELNQPNEEAVVHQISTVSCAFPKMTDQNGTKVSLATTGKTQWEVGDKIVIYGNPSSSDDSKRIVHEIVAGDIVDPEVAVFDVDFSGLDAQYNSSGEGCKYFPYTVAYPYTDGQQYYLSTGNNNYGRSRFQNTNQLLMAGHVSDDNSSIVLNHLTAAITFSVDGDFDSYTFSGADGTEVVGYSTFVVEMNRRTLGEGQYRQKYNDGGTTGPLTSIQGSVNGDGTSVNHIFLPVNADKSGSAPYTYDLTSQRYADVVYLPNGFTIKFFKGGDFKQYITSTAPLIIEPGHMINLGLLPAGALHDYVAPTSHDATHPAITGAADLSTSATKTANCYIVDGSVAANAGKTFKFPAVKGNGTTSVGKVASATILWETYNNAESVTANSIVKDADFDYQDGDDYSWITFEMPSTLHAGNAVIAAKDDSDNILWSWHIWVPSTSITYSTYGGISTALMMDRNLGALVIAEGDADTDIAVESCGMFYQWGRKDPFPGPGSLPGGYNATSAKVNGSVGTRDKTSYTEIHKYPNSFVVTGADSADSDKDWTPEHSSALWGSSKNENDPCPPGWKLPIFASETGDIWDSSVAAKSGLVGYTENQTHHWLKLGVAYDALNPTTTGYVYFPYAGYRTQDNGGFAYAGDRIHVWQAKGGSGAYARLLYGAPSLKYVDTQRKGRGGNVRCVAE